MTQLPPVTTLLESAVSALGGAHRDGQVRMASAVANAIDTGEHLAVQAGTGTGKSLAYLVPALRHAVDSGTTVVVSTATIALQRQLIERDLPRLAKALTKPLKRAPTFAILKGRSNYVCLNKVHSGEAEEQTDELFDAFTMSRVGREVVRLREWVSDTESGDRDELPIAVLDRSWKQISVSARECLGATNCSYGTDCFAELARAEAGSADVVVTNHAMLAIDAMSGFNVLPEHDVVIVDEAHELVDRITSVATAEISPGTVAGVARRCAKLIDEELADDISGAGELVAQLLDQTPPGRWTRLPDGAPETFAGLRDRLWRARSAIGPARGNADPAGAAARSAAITALDDLHDNAVRLLGAFDEPDESKRRDVVWIAEDLVRDERRRVIRIAPLSVGGLLRSSLFNETTAILTSATLTIGGTFDNLAANWGLPISGRGADTTAPLSDLTATGSSVPADGDTFRWQGVDVGSPFDYRTSAILYVAAHLDPPGRAGIAPATIDEMVALIESAGGRTLGLFSSIRAAKEAAALVRERIDHPVLCQGENATGTLISQFAADESTCLFGTLSLWQGVDVPGPSLSLVLIDRVPFPRPDDPLLIARQAAVAARGGNGFLAVAANHAALLLAQGAGRLLRATDDRGVVAVLDPRLVTARYGGYLRASLPPFWQTSDPAVVRAALTRLHTTASNA
ncbi:ATP-dependent DNA helicase [Williamsia maris]|uniref:DNA 5'-3' helicase n=1 Tax=Williamsia maris TaxID=72806 RepID=A0ABT1HLA8_9NOCA|nr:ATP-dependent DNA helicase [Williamsia maris]MCP2178729.1 ATP-dependent DNA helicase DinG [Williamsia maris]